MNDIVAVMHCAVFHCAVTA